MTANVGIAEIKRKYIYGPVAVEIEKQMAVLEESYQLVMMHQGLLGGALEVLSEGYDNAALLAASSEVDDLEKQELLYLIYAQYFQCLSSLSWKKRRAIKADQMIRKMKKCIKRDIPEGVAAKYWIPFLKSGVPLFLVSIIFEWIFLDSRDRGIAIISFIVFAVSLIGYFYVCYQFEGRRLYIDLHKWIRYRLNPQGHGRPVGIIQVLKLVIPPMATLGSALLKIYLG